MTRMAHASRTWWILLSAWLVIGWVGMHLMGVAMTAALEERLGFFPIWFLDCVACSSPDSSLPYGPAVIGGVSLAAIVALPVAMLVAVGGRRSIEFWPVAAGVVLVAAMTIHVVVTWPSRYPGSLPPVAVAVVLPLLAAIAGAIGLFGIRSGNAGQIYERRRLSMWSIVCLASGVLSMTLLGGTLSVIALGLCGWRLRLAKPGMERVLVICGVVLALLSIVLRVLLRVRYPSIFGWFW